MTRYVFRNWFGSSEVLIEPEPAWVWSEPTTTVDIDDMTADERRELLRLLRNRAKAR